MLARLLAAAVLAVTFGFGWHSLDRVDVLVVGQPSTTGVIQADIEQPFFANIAADTGLPLDIEYRPVDDIGFKDTFQLQLLERGVLDLVSLRFLQNASSEPTLLGVDLLGLSTDFGTARVLVDAYGPVLARRLEERFNSRLLGIWPFGPQVFFCRVPIGELADLSGLKVRVGNDNFAPLISSLGATPVVVSFEDVKTALRNDLIDCAITSASSGNAAGWPEVTTHYYPLGMHMGLNGYAMNLDVWNRLSGKQQSRLQAAFDEHVGRIWDRAEQVDADAAACNVGGPCVNNTPYQLVSVPPSAGDVRRVHDAYEATTFVDWAQKCDAVYPGCAREWQERVLPALANMPSEGG